MTLRNLLIALAVAALAGFVLADALPDQSTLTLTDSSGTLVGSGTYVGGNLTLDVLGSFSGDATLTVTTRGGETLTYDVTVDQTDGTITLTGTDTALQDLNPSIAARGGTVSIDLTAVSVEAPTLPAPGPNWHANQHAFDHAGQGVDNAPSGEGSTNASEHAHAGSGNAGH